MYLHYAIFNINACLRFLVYVSEFHMVTYSLVRSKYFQTKSCNRDVLRTVFTLLNNFLYSRGKCSNSNTRSTGKLKSRLLGLVRDWLCSVPMYLILRTEFIALYYILNNIQSFLRSSILNCFVNLTLRKFTKQCQTFMNLYHEVGIRNNFWKTKLDIISFSEINSRYTESLEIVLRDYEAPKLFHAHSSD